MNNTYNWYSTLQKPTWAPPSWLFGPLWSILYIIIAFAYGAVFYKVYIKELPPIIALPFILNLIFNFSFTYFQFGLKNNLLASIDILLILATLVWAIVVIYPHFKWIAIVNTPYLLWVIIATVLQLTITWMNK